VLKFRGKISVKKNRAEILRKNFGKKIMQKFRGENFGKKKSCRNSAEKISMKKKRTEILRKNFGKKKSCGNFAKKIR
jgi:hypothetical protein